MAFWKHMTIEPVVFFYVVAIFAEYDVIGDLFYVSKCIQHLSLSADKLHICTESKKNHTAISNEISKEANKAQQIYNGLLYAMSIVSSFVAATYADRRSKMLPIIIAILGSLLVQIVILTALSVAKSESGLPILFASSNGLAIIYVCGLISGITGGTSTLLASCFAHVAEVCDQRQRTSRITIIEACLFGGGFFGFTFAGAILRRYPNSLERYYFNFGLYLLLHFLMACYVVARRNMFHKPQTQTRMTFKLLCTSVFRTIGRKRELKNLRLIICLILAAFTIISYWNVSITTMLFIYTRNKLSWETWKYSYFSSAKFGICGIFLCLLPALQYLLATDHLRIRSMLTQPLSDGTIITIGLLSRSISIMAIGLASIWSDYFMFVALVTIIFAEYPIPAIRSMISKIVEPNEKAQVFAVLAAIQSVCFFTGGIGFLAIYNGVLHHISPGWIFIIIGLFQIVSMFLFWYVQHLIKECNAEQRSNHEIRVGEITDPSELVE